MTPRTLARMKILVADDNALLRRGLKEMLSLWGVGRVVTAGDGSEARALLCSEPIDLVVTDWVMAPVDGAALLRWIRHAPDSPRPDLPVIVLTAQADVPTVRAAWDAGADAVLAKPVSAVVIARRIEAVLRQPRRPAPAAPHAAPPTPAGEALFPQVAGSEAPRLSVAPGTPAERERRLRLLLALDRLEGVLDRPAPNLAALRIVTADLQHAAAGDPLLEEIARSLARCVTRVDPFVPAFLDTLRAHHAGLRWLVTREGDATVADASLAACLAAGVDSLIERHPIVEGTMWEESEAPRPPRGPRLLG
ncbi:response regulator [Azospirillum sp.]|uniref:response regulator n=1 Tax=Azospirillum sp. TaxID=34012 RepID=UPI003D709745